MLLFIRCFYIYYNKYENLSLNSGYFILSAMLTFCWCPNTPWPDQLIFSLSVSFIICGYPSTVSNQTMGHDIGRWLTNLSNGQKLVDLRGAPALHYKFKPISFLSPRSFISHTQSYNPRFIWVNGCILQTEYVV